MYMCMKGKCIGVGKARVVNIVIIPYVKEGSYHTKALRKLFYKYITQERSEQLK